MALGRWAAWCVGWALVTAGLPGTASAQAPAPGGIGNPGSARDLLPELAPGLPRQPDVGLPPIAPAPGGPAAGPRVFVREVVIEGATALPEAELAAVVEPFLRRELSAADLEELRRRLTLAYVSRGYVSSGAVLPDQQVQDGVVRYRIVEGRLAEVVVDGTGGLDPDYVRQRLARGLEPPLDVRRLEENLQLLLQDPLIRRMDVELLPGLAPGEARLRADVTRADPYALSGTVANDQAPSIGSLRGELAGVARNLTGRGDALALSYGRTEGLDDYGIAWSVPLTAADTRFSLGYERNRANVVSDTFDDLDIESRSRTISVGLSHPLYRTPQESLVLGVVLDQRKSETRLLGQPFSFTPGVDNGTARVSVLRLSQDWLRRGSTDVIALRSTFSLGLDAFDATMSAQQPDGTFLAWLGQAQYVRQVTDDLLVVLRGDVQLARDPLFPLEQIAVGGANTVRGYRENLLVRDNAAIASIEARYAVARFAVPWFGGGSRDSVVQLAPFADYGNAWSTDTDTPDPRDIGSVGIGLRWEIADLLTAQIYYGYALRDVDVDDHNLQDEGVHFRVTTRLY